MAESRPDAPAARPKGSRGRKRLTFGILIIVFGCIAVALFIYLQYKKTHISTDDAFIDGHIHTIAPKISGTVKSINVEDNQKVAAGTLLVEIVPDDFAVVLKAAQAALDAEVGRLGESRARVATARKQAEEARAAYDAALATLELQRVNRAQAKIDFDRAQELFNGGAVPKETFDKANTGLQGAESQVKVGEANVKQLAATVETSGALIAQAESGIPTQEAQVEARRAALESAELNLKYTKIFAPVEGRVTRRNAEIGNQVQAGQPLLAVVPLDPKEIWITANFKETQLTRVRPGQKVEIEVDAFPGRKFEGHVDTIMAGTGSVFSLFPPENATGNFVKVVQRVPVKIVFDGAGADSDSNFRLGMSVAPTILVEGRKDAQGQ